MLYRPYYCVDNDLDMCEMTGRHPFSTTLVFFTGVCEWEWGQYEVCSVTCGGGLQSRFPVIIMLAENGGNCPQEVVDGEPQTQSCNTKECPREYSALYAAVYSHFMK